jgi:Putative metal-binding motif/FG-GAP repeat
MTTFRHPFVLLATLLTACDGKRGDPDDQDGDGVLAIDDCDDNDSSSFPGATESCDGVDNDCDGEVDNGVTTSWYVDADGDGHGDREAAPIGACEAPDGYASVGGDCNDSSDETYPGAPELCDTIDNNCDGVSDDGVGKTYYIDSDLDTYGLAGTGFTSCESTLEGWSANYDDCDDTDASVNPGAAEVCGDLDDDDCDGIADVGLVSTWYSDDDSDGYGSPGDSEETCEPQVGWVLDNSDCRPSDGAAYPGSAEVCNDIDDNCDGVVDDGMDVDGDGYRHDSCADGTDCDDTDSDIYPDSPNDLCGDGIDQDCSGADKACGFDGETLLSGADGHVYSSISGWYTSLLTDIGDPTGDGINDVLSSTLYANSYGGGGYVVPGPITGAGAYSDVAHRISGSAALTYGAGRSIGIGDINGDGVDDVGFGAPYGTYAGMYIEYGPITGDRTLTDPDLWLSCRANIYCGHGGDLGDFTGDGIADAAIGAYYNNSGGTASGTVYLLEGPVTAETALATYATAIDGEAASTYTGRFMYIGGDVNGDGIGDILAAAPYATGSAYVSGIVYLILGPGTHLSSMASADASLLGPGYGGYLGEGRPMSAQDVDGDGYADPAVGSYATSTGSSAGGAYLMFGPVTGDVDLRTADVIIEGSAAGAYAGSSVAHGDIDANGTYELLVGARGDSTGARSGGGAYMFTSLSAGTYTTADADAWFTGDVTAAYAGTSAFMGDLNGDGRDDVALGAPYDSTGATGGGGVFIQYASD